MREYGRPKTKRQLRAFLGSVGYYCQETKRSRGKEKNEETKIERGRETYDLH